ERKNGSGFMTIPGPPPYGTSSTTRCRSVVKSRRSCTPTASTPASIPRATTPSASGASNMRGKIVTMSKRTLVSGVQVQQPLGRVDHDSPRRGIDLHADRRDERHQHLATAVHVDHE